jgi:hypothetical protein
MCITEPEDKRGREDESCLKVTSYLPWIVFTFVFIE